MAKSISDQMAHALGQRDEQPNIDLAIRLTKSKNATDIREVVDLLKGKKTAIAHDAIKVLYEIGERNADLVAPFLPQFLETLMHKDNRMKWGAMTALSAISKAKPDMLAKHIATIVDAMDQGSVITRDHGVYILTDLARLKKYHADCIELLLEQLEKAPVNQLPMYAERTSEVISAPFVKRMIAVLKKRNDVMEIPSKAKRLEKVIRQIQLV